MLLSKGVLSIEYWKLRVNVFDKTGVFFDSFGKQMHVLNSVTF